MNLYDLIGNLKDVGFYDILLPWALFFAIVYGLLTSVGPFSTKKKDGKEPMDKSIPAMISMAVAFFAIAYTPFGMNFGIYLAEMFGKSGTVLAGLLMLSLFLGMAGIKLPEGFGKDDNKRTKNFLIIVAIITAIIYFTTGFGDLINFTSPTFTEDTIITFLVILALAGGIYMMVKDDSGKKVKKEKVEKDEEE
ncbi:MAG: hypothetical protein KAJ56_02605 [Candidatus Aenigmarchaeota archaeon]|nr:hypothetical protein [Candidatus Aenigmarchaeota archaeon]